MNFKLSWHRLIQSWQKDFKFVLFLVGLMMVFRFAMVAIFHDQRAEEGTFIDYVLFFQRSLLFDLRVALTVGLPAFILGFIAAGSDILERWVDQFRLAIGTVLIVFTIILYVGDIGFFAEYHDQYNHWIYGLFHDDLSAILNTIWKTYPVFWIAVGIIILSILSLILFYKWMKSNILVSVFINNKISTSWVSGLWKLILILFILVIYVIGLRGSLLSRPLQRDDVGVTTDPFLNKLVTNPYFALYYTYSDNKHLNRASGLEVFLKDKSIYNALKLIYPEKKIDSNNIDDWIENSASGSLAAVLPKHIFLIILESQDNWPLLDEYAWLDLAPNLKALGAQGIHVKSFVSAGVTTRTTLDSIITGLPDAQVFTNFQPNSQQKYSTAFSIPFQQLGYQVNLFYGGHLTWQRLGELAHNQGFDNTYGREHMPLNAKGDSWGVFDEELFDFILKKLDPDIPSVNLIMTTSNHSPYPVDLQEKGCLHILYPENYSKLNESVTNSKILGHLWYNDYCVGRFIKDAEKNFAPSLFAITGDHTSRRFFSSKPSIYEYKSVPLILYGPEVLEGVKAPEHIAGAHMDILPTIVELIAPKGFRYLSLGSNILNASSRQIGFGAGIVITPNSIWSISDKIIFKFVLEDENLTDSTQYLEDLYNAIHGVGWWRIMRGNKF